MQRLGRERIIIFGLPPNVCLS